MRRIFYTAALFVSGILPVAAQQSSFLFVAQQGSSATTVSPGAVINLNATKIGDSATFQLIATYRGTLTATITDMELIGSPDLKLLDAPKPPVVLKPGDKVTLTVSFTSSTI